MSTSESDPEVSPIEIDLETKSDKSSRKTTKGKTNAELLMITSKSEETSRQSASSFGDESEFELSVPPVKSAKTKAAAEPKTSKSNTSSENEAKNEPSPPPVKPAPKSSRTRVAAEPKTSKSNTTSENDAKTEPSPLPVKPAPKSSRTRVAAEPKTSKSAVPTPSAATSENEDDVSPPRAKTAPKSKAKTVKPATRENDDDVSPARAKPAPKLKAKMPVEAKTSKSKIPTPPSSDNEVEEILSPPVVKPVTRTKSKTAKGKTTRSKTPVIPTNIPEIKNATDMIEPVASTSKASTAKAAKSKTARTSETNIDEMQDEKMEKASTSEMVTAALTNLANRKGTSLVAIKKYVNEHYAVDLGKYGKHINNYLKKSVEAGSIIQLTGKGATGSFKLPKPDKKSTKPKKSEVVKEKIPKLNKKAKMVVVSTPKRRSFKVVSSKRKSMSAPKAVALSKKPTRDTGANEIIEKETKPKRGKRMKSSAETVEADELKPKKETRTKRK